MRKPWNNTLIVKFFLSYVSVVALLFVGFFYFALANLRELHLTTIGKTLDQQAKLIARAIPHSAGGPQLDRLCRELGRELGIRITLIATDGTVLGDSEEASTAMENHAARPEVQAALAAGSGTSLRYSTTVGYDMLYRAFLQHNGATARVVRVAIPLSDIHVVTHTLRSQLLLSLGLVSAAGLLFAYFFASKAARRLCDLVSFASEITQGSFPQREFPAADNDELNTLEHQLSVMSRRLAASHSELVSEKGKLDSILDCMIEGMLVVDRKGKLLLINEPAKKIFRIDPERVRAGASLVELSRHPAVRKIVDEVMQYDFAAERYLKDLELDQGRWFKVSGSNLRDARQETVGFILVFHDNTQLKRLETIRADFVANVSHELRTPLTAIRGYVETLMDSPPSDPADTRQFLGIIERHSERLSRLTDDLLTLSDLESGNARLQQTRIDAQTLIARALEVFWDKAKKNRIDLRTDVEADLAAIVGDSDRLQQLLINLVDNAVKYTPQGGAVTVSARKAEIAGHAAVALAVSDTGVGIPDKDLPRLTERFYRVDKARSRELGGTGLGLAIVKHIAQAHGGELTIESVLNHGTTVTVRLPSAGHAAPHRTILFLCTANSCRSQMAEGFARAMLGNGDRAFSAGTEPKGVHPLAVRAMNEVGIDISGQRSKAIEEIPLDEVDQLITLCGDAAEHCPVLPGKIARSHWPLPDPARAEGSEEEVMNVFRRVRDDIRRRVQALLAPSSR
jgi:two-component system phosphate regulon sensor histidine kinase PhoR